MFFPLLKPARLLDETSVLWMFDTFIWALRNFDATIFYNETILVTPSNTHFPGNESSADGMAQLIFDKVKTYACMQHWPCCLISEHSKENIAARRIQLVGFIRGTAAMTPAPVGDPQKLVIPYNQEHLRDPEVLIAEFAYTLAHFLGTTAKEAPPGGEENWHHVVELLAVFMGFGVMMANSANTVKIRSCSSCSGPAVERQNYLSQYDMTYALAIFCCLKNISARETVKNLKSSLRPFFKKAMKDVLRKKILLEQVQKMMPAV